MYRKRDTLGASTQVANYMKICDFYPKIGQNDTPLTTSGDLMLSSYSLYNMNLQTKNGKIIFKPLYALTLKLEKNPLSQEAIDFLDSNPNPDLLKNSTASSRAIIYYMKKYLCLIDKFPLALGPSNALCMSAAPLPLTEITSSTRF